MTSEARPDNPMDLAQLVRDKITALGSPAIAQEYFGVSPAAISTWKSGKIAPTLKAAQKVVDEMGFVMPTPQSIAAIAAMPMMEIVEQLPVNNDNPYDVGSGDRVVILSPAYDGVEQKMMTTLFKCIKGYGWDKVSIIPGSGRTLIEEERNDLVAKYRKIPNKPEFVIMIDADHVLPCGHSGMLRKLGVDYPEAKAMRNALVRIMSHPKEYLIVGGLYKNRRFPHKPACEIAYRSPQEDARLRALFDPLNKSPQSDKLEECGWLGAGFLRIHYSVFDRMEEASKNGGPLAEIAPPPGRESDPPGFFGRNSKLRGEDVFFCRRAAEIGIKSHCDMGLLVAHITKGVV